MHHIFLHCAHTNFPFSFWLFSLHAKFIFLVMFCETESKKNHRKLFRNKNFDLKTNLFVVAKIIQFYNLNSWAKLFFSSNIFVKLSHGEKCSAERIKSYFCGRLATYKCGRVETYFETDVWWHIERSWLRFLQISREMQNVCRQSRVRVVCTRRITHRPYVAEEEEETKTSPHTFMNASTSQRRKERDKHISCLSWLAVNSERSENIFV